MTYHFDSEKFGMPNYGLSQTREDQFRRINVSNIGRGQSYSHNPSGGQPVNVTWTWDGDTLNAFREDWEDPQQLNFGARWFTIDLPLHMQDLPQNYLPATAPVEVANSFSIVNGGPYAPEWYGYVRGVSGSPYSMAPINGKDITEFGCATGDVLFLKFGSGVQITDAKGAAMPTLRVGLPFLPGYEILSWTESVSRYQGVMPGAYTYFANQSYNVYALVYTEISAYQRYQCHFLGPYQAVASGHDRWRVTAALEVDLAAPLVYGV